jgi:hypothetical protein
MLARNTSKFLSGYTTSDSRKEYSRTPLCPSHIDASMCVCMCVFSYHIFKAGMELMTSRALRKEREGGGGSCRLLRTKPDASSTVAFISLATLIFGRTHAQVDLETSSLQ